jgi:hypothetical protein
MALAGFTIMISEHLREARSACERQFSFLVTEFGYRKVRCRFQWNGFELRYRGPLVGVVVEWFPRDTLTVRLARLVNGDFSSSCGGGDAPINYFDLGDIESLASAPGDYTNCRTMKRRGSWRGAFANMAPVCYGATYR